MVVLITVATVHRARGQDGAESGTPDSVNVETSGLEEKPASTAGTEELLVEERQALYKKIMEAKEAGVGISSYMLYFQTIEEKAKAGIDPAGVSKMIGRLSLGLDEQLQRKEYLKSQKPQAAVSNLDGGGNLPIESLKERFGDRLPKMISDPAVQEKLKESPILKDPAKRDALRKRLEERFGGQLPDLSGSDAETVRKLKEKVGGQLPANLDDPQLRQRLKESGFSF